MPSAVYAAATDRSLGGAARALRLSCTYELATNALASREFENRRSEIFRRVSAALHKASDADGTSTSPEAVGRTLEILAALPQDIPLPQVIVESENEVGLDWDEGSRRVVSLTVRDNPMVGFAAFFGAEPLYGRMPFVGEVPQTLRFLLTRLFPEQPSRSAGTRRPGR